MSPYLFTVVHRYLIFTRGWLFPCRWPPLLCHKFWLCTWKYTVTPLCGRFLKRKCVLDAASNLNSALPTSIRHRKWKRTPFADVFIFYCPVAHVVCRYWHEQNSECEEAVYGCFSNCYPSNLQLFNNCDDSDSLNMQKYYTCGKNSCWWIKLSGLVVLYKRKTWNTFVGVCDRSRMRPIVQKFILKRLFFQVPLLQK